VAVLTSGKNVVVFFDTVEWFGAFSQTQHDFIGFLVHRDQSLSRFRLAGANYDDSIQEIDILPLELLDLALLRFHLDCQQHERRIALFSAWHACEMRDMHFLLDKHFAVVRNSISAFLSLNTE
jgi:hypothetical protein